MATSENVHLPLDFIAGCFGGAAGVLAGHPLDTVKVRLQAQVRDHCIVLNARTRQVKGPSRVYTGCFHCVTSIARREGPLALYSGMTSPLYSLAIVNAIAFGVQRATVRQFADADSTSAHFWGGCAAGAAQSVIAAPSERAKLLVQLQATDPTRASFTSPIQAVRLMVRQYGWSGYLATLLRDTPSFGIYFLSYECLARAFSSDGTMASLQTWQLLVAGGLAGQLSWLGNYPTDVVKTRFQADDSYKSYADCIRRTYREGGWRAFYLGMGSTLLRAFPANAATFFTVDWTYRLLLDADPFGLKRRHEL